MRIDRLLLVGSSSNALRSGFMFAFVKIIDRIMSLICIVLMFILLIAVILSVILRYVFNISFVQYEEAVTMIFIATTYFGMSLGVREGDHIAITFFSDKAPLRVRKAIEIVVTLIMIGVAYVMVRQSLIWIQRVGSAPSPGMRVPFKYFYSIVPVSFIILIFYSCINIASQFFPIPPAERGYELDHEATDSECLIKEESE